MDSRFYLYEYYMPCCHRCFLQQIGTQNAVKTVCQMSNSDDQHQQRTVLRVIIENLVYAVTIDILKQAGVDLCIYQYTSVLG